MKKLLSFILVIALFSSMVVMSTSAISTELSESGYEWSDTRCISLKDAIRAYETENEVKVETYRNYFYIPETAEDYLGSDNTDIPSWCNKYSQDICIWYDFSMAENSPVPESYCGYKIEKLLDNVYYADIPVGVTQFSINNGVEAEEKPVHSACSTPVLGLEAADKYGKFPNHDGEIYVINQFDRDNKCSTALFKGKWYQYKGDDCYANLKNDTCINPTHDHRCVSVAVSEALKKHEEQTGEKIETNRYYFLMPNGENGEIGDDDSVDYEGYPISPYYGKYAPSWYNDYSKNAGIYWWDCGVADPEYWPGYTMEKSNVRDVYYADVPKAATTIIFNNNVNSGVDPESDIYYASYQSVNIPCEYYDVGESNTYPDGLDTFDNMIFVIDPDLTSINEFDCKVTLGGEWYYYYGNGCYGTVKDSGVYDCIRDDHEHTVKSAKDAIAEYEAQTGEKVELSRYYFLMPDGTNGEKGDDDTRDHEGFRYSLYYDEYAPSWYNEYTNTAGIYWFDSGIADPEYWPGYTMEPSDSENVYYADVPKEVTTIIFNNYIDSGMDSDLEIYYSSHQSVNVQCEYYDVGESENYPDGLDAFDNMIYVIDPDLNSYFELGGRPTWGGEWYYYYGDGCYGFEKDGNSTNCLRDDHNHKTIHESFAEYLGITVDEEHTYSGELYSHYEDGAQAPSWVLVNGYAGQFLPDDMLFGVFGDYYLYGCSSYPSYFNFHIYMVDEQKFYTLEDAWSMDICHKEEIFTEYLIKNNSAHLIGDADKDRKLTVMDATQIQRAEAKLCTIDDWIMASHCYGDKITLSTDFNRDGSRSVLDATAIQKKIAKLD